MSNIFSLDEIIKFAIEKEKESYELYKKLAEITDTPKAQNLFNFLKKAELKHEKYYENLLKNINLAVPTKEDESFDAYMQELIKVSRKYSKDLAILIEDRGAALEYAIEREKDSVLFYAGLKDYVPEVEQAHLDEIIKEESTHINKLLEIKDFLGL
jgi:rubrerythrin